MDKKSYIAGIIDGEGSIMLSRANGKYRVPTISVSNTTYELIEFLSVEYGGTISKQKIYKEQHKQSWTWVLRYDAALAFLVDIGDMLLVPQKRNRAIHILTEYKNCTVRNGRYTAEELERKLKFEADFFKF